MKEKTRKEVKELNEKEFIEKKLSSKLYTEQQLKIYSVFTAISMTFFIALLGADKEFMDSFLSRLCIIAFSISLVFNAYSAFIIQNHIDTEDGRRLIMFMNEIKYSTFGISQCSFTASIILLIFFFSVTASIIFGALICLLLLKYKKEIELYDKEKDAKDLKKIREIESSLTNKENENKYKFKERK